MGQLHILEQSFIDESYILPDLNFFEHSATVLYLWVTAPVLQFNVVLTAEWHRTTAHKLNRTTAHKLNCTTEHELQMRQAAKSPIGNVAPNPHTKY